MKKSFLILSITLIALLFITCTDEANTTPSGTDADYAELSLFIGIPGNSQIRAGDPFSTPTEEVEIHSVACFIKTNDTGVIGTPGYKQGSFHKYFSDIAPGQENGFEEALTDNGDGTYNVKLHIRSNSFGGQTSVIMIANYVENGLASRLKAVNEWEELGSFQTEAVTTAGISTPLLMYGKAEVALQIGQSVIQIFNMQRIMSRIDIYNKVPDDVEKLFELQSARIVNPKQYSYLLPGNENAYHIPVLSDGFTSKSPETDNPRIIEGLYTYETANDGSTEHTAIEISGTFGDEPYSRLIKLLKGTEPVPLGRNTRYQITLNAQPEDNEINFTFKIEDWSEGLEIPGKPIYNKPELKTISFTKGSPAGLVNERYWDTATKTYNLAYVTNGDKINFIITGYQENELEISFDKDDGSSLGLNTPEDIKAFITKKPPVVTRNSIVEQEFEINFTQKPVRDIDVHIHIKNAVKPGYKETIHLTCWYYPGTVYSPVKFGGIYWAPVNVGQTILGSELQNRETMGYVYQWARNKEYDSFVELADAEILKGPAKLAEANSPANINKFITSAGGDWLLTGEDSVPRNNLWIEGKDGNTPCPAGWRIPTKAEYQLLVDQYNDNKMIDEQYYRFVFIGDDRQNLYFPYMGYINYTNGKISPPSQRTLVWTVTLAEPPKRSVSTFDIIPSLSREFLDHPTAYAFGVRCVRK